MVDTFTRKEKLSDAFLVLGSQYFAFARYSAENVYLPVSATLFHHAIEMLLKGFLIKSKSINELKKVSHDLSKLWELFIIESNLTTLSNFDMTINSLNKVESLRYPESIVDNGFTLNIRIGTPVPLILPGTENLPHYLVNVSDLDDIALEIFTACGVQPSSYFQNTPSELLATLPQGLRP